MKIPLRLLQTMRLAYVDQQVPGMVITHNDIGLGEVQIKINQ
jgi:hypothetical protein